ncbi:glycosyltransferase [Thiomicrorhabdus sp.]|uniref:glycosyltransferase n=1 Tax=Thiomicrorhabdus sp. TaxID=2039724 RepID=UPI0029C712A8|nr:glycosyltransferase [Thiomicrorhabdus sp.]
MVNLTHSDNIASQIYYAALLFLLVSLAVYYIPGDVWYSDASNYFWLIGVIAIWRYSWKLLNLGRALLYKHTVYPFIKSQALKHYREPEVLYVLITSYRMEPKMNFRVYQSLVEEAQTLNCPVHIIALVTDEADLRIFNLLQSSTKHSSQVFFHNIFQQGTGKRSAMYDGLKFIKELGPPPKAPVIFMDGDTIVGKDAIKNAYAVLNDDARLGAVTTNNRALVQDDRSFVREWYRLRMMNRDMYMSSHALSRKVLVLTGRFSMFKAQVVMSNEFIQSINFDMIEHWRLQKVRMLTGDDKTTWFYTLKAGWDMLYLPDTYVYPVEVLPQRSFFLSSTSLTQRWSGNMLRNNYRALKLGCKKLNIFPWFAVLDQRISIWTTLSGPLFATAIMVWQSVDFFWVYLLWIIVSRFFQAMLLFLSCGQFHPVHILLLFYDQFMGSIVKSFNTFFLDRQRWERHNTGRINDQQKNLGSGVMWIASMVFIFVAIIYVIVNTPSLMLL